MEQPQINPLEPVKNLPLRETNLMQANLIKKSGIKRTTLYDTIETLKAKELIGVISKDKKIWVRAPSLNRV